MTPFYDYWITQLATRDATLAMLVLYAVSMYVSWVLVGMMPAAPTWTRPTLITTYIILFCVALVGPQAFGALPQ